jgi:lactosylceramide 4-alpha-galactosyltransferase
MTREKCDGFSVLPAPICFEINYPEWRKFFNEVYAEEVLQRTKNSAVVHFWNFMSTKEKLETKSRAAYIQLAEKYCPRVLRAAGDYFW